ncbi:hypothetical protein POTOM_032469 [Populus tomentosa]|uniref:Uncharacterized protein n=1 Tax=Populus tomentosa TaxID=118781 RepID=A0A8X8CQC1_POPTO|nr:hypothetical protein POTOM_032469 [Populus tomentosa]
MFLVLFKSLVIIAFRILQVQGGPGCSCPLALFHENGPFHIENNLSLSWNYYGWDKASNIIFVDQITGTGFSSTTDPSDIRNDENGVSDDFLQGFAIGNGLTQPDIQFKAYTDFALENKLIQKSDYDSINELIPVCEQAIKDCGTDGVYTCENAMVALFMTRWLLIYAGEEDLIICNWLGNSRWVNALAWSGKKKAIGEAPTVSFVVEGKKAGKLKGLGFLKVILYPLFFSIAFVCALTIFTSFSNNSDVL